eukprot:Pompholyxophrys_punicea_v1_NODE_162_length_3055_cov_4.636000.p7 type:complete len:104 gc:universal NODE_162_length_3055_cov_4.636000:2167-1856(-)
METLSTFCRRTGDTGPVHAVWDGTKKEQSFDRPKELVALDGRMANPPLRLDFDDDRVDDGGVAGFVGRHLLSLTLDGMRIHRRSSCARDRVRFVRLVVVVVGR